MPRLKFVMLALVAAVASLLAPMRSEAGFSLTVQQGSTYGTNGSMTFDGQTNIATNPNGTTTYSPGTITVGDYVIMFTIGTTNTPGFQGQASALTLNSLFVTYTGLKPNATPLVITLTATDFTLPVSPVTATSNYSGNFLPGASTSASVTLQSFIDTNNAANGTGTAIIPNNGLTFGAGSGASNQSSSVTVSYGDGLPPNQVGAFSLTSRITLTNFGTGDVLQSGSISTSVVAATPAPPGLVLVASALPFAALVRFRRRAVAPVTAA